MNKTYSVSVSKQIDEQILFVFEKKNRGEIEPKSKSKILREIILTGLEKMWNDGFFKDDE